MKVINIAIIILSISTLIASVLVFFEKIDTVYVLLCIPTIIFFNIQQYMLKRKGG